MNIQESYFSREEGLFYIKALNSYKNREKSSKNLTIFLIQCDQMLLNNVANELELQVYNRKKKFLDTFLADQAHNYEQFMPIELQTIILFLLNEEFDVDQYQKEKIILQHFPLHDFQQRTNI